MKKKKFIVLGVSLLGIPEITTIIFVILKLTYKIFWDWIYVLMPATIHLSIVLLIILVWLIRKLKRLLWAKRFEKKYHLGGKE